MLKIHGLPFSAHTRKVIAGAREKGLDYELVPTMPLKPTPEFLAISPLAKIPVLDDGRVVLPDSSAIALYLDRVHPERPLYPADPALYARALWIEEYVDGDLAGLVLHGLLFQRVFARFAGREPDAAVVARSLAAIPERLDYLESQLSSEWFAGEFSYADITVASMLVNFHYGGESVDEHLHPELHGFVRRALARPCFAGALEIEAPAAADVEGLDMRLLRELGH